MADNKTNYDEIQDEYLDNIIRLAYKNAEGIETQELLEADDAADDEIPSGAKDAAFRLFLEKMEQEEKQNARQTRAIQWKRVLPRIVNAAACIVVILGVSAPFAVAHVEAIRVRVLQMLISYHDNYIDVNLVEDESASFYVPADYTGEYFPAYIPEYCKLSAVGRLTPWVEYDIPNGRKMGFSEENEDTSASYSTLNATISYVDINGNTATVIDKVRDEEHFVTIVWTNGEYFFDVMGVPSVEEAIRIAKSVRKIPK